MDLVRKFLDLLQQGGGMIHVARGILPHAELGHLVHQLGIEETLFPRLRLAGLDCQRIDGLLVEGFVVERGSADR